MACVPWTIDTGCCGDWDALTPELQARAEELAWATLRVLTAGMVGHCPTVFRPCVDVPCNACASVMSGPWMTPTIRSGQWVNTVCGGHSCACTALSEIVLPGRVARVDAITVDGELMPEDSWRLDGNRIVRLDGGTWPACQDMRLAEYEVGTTVVEYVPGVDPGPAGAWAAGVLACEYAKACTGGKCRLPASVTSIARQGVVMQIDNGLFGNGLTGIREVDGFVFSVNPNAMKIAPRVWSPDVVHGRLTG